MRLSKKRGTWDMLEPAGAAHNMEFNSERVQTSP